jgi:hypothetical protein
MLADGVIVNGHKAVKVSLEPIVGLLQKIDSLNMCMVRARWAIALKIPQPMKFKNFPQMNLNSELYVDLAW